MSRLTHTARAATVIVATGALLLVAGCAPSEPAGPANVEVWARQGDQAMPALVDAFNASHEDIVVELTVVPDAELITKFSTAVRSGNTPDVVDFDIIDGPLLATQGTLLDITDRIAALDGADDLIPAFVDAGTIDGRNYAVPVVGVGSQMVWNKGLFEQAGLDPDVAPESLKQIAEYATKIRALGPDIYGFSTIGGMGQAFTGFPSIWATGGDVLTAAGEDQEATFTDPAVIDVLSWYHDTWESGVMPPTDAPNADPNGLSGQAALAGQIGIMFSGTWIARAGDPSQEYGYVGGIPGLDGGLSSFIGGQSAGIVADTEVADQAWAFLEWVLSDEEAAAIIAESGAVPGNLAAAAAQFADDPIALSVIEALKVGQAPISVAYSAVINDANGPYASASQAVIFNGADPESELSRAEEDARAIIEDTYATLGG